MLIYYLLFAFTLIFAFTYSTSRKEFVYLSFNVRNEKKYGKGYLIIIFSSVCLIIGLRSISVGIDTINYVNEFYYGVLEHGVFSGYQEIMINLIAWFCQLFSKDYQLFLFVNGLLVAVLFGKFIYDNSINPVLSSIIFVGMFFVPSMNLMREWLAIGFGINGISFLKKNKVFLGILFLILAFLTHITAICLVPISLVWIFKNKKHALYLIIIGCLTCYFLRFKILNFIVSIVPRYSGYLTQSMFAGSGTFNIKDLIFIVIELFYFYLLFFTKIEDKNELFEYAAILFVAIILSLCGRDFYIMHRVVYFYSVFLIVSIPKAIEKTKFKDVLFFFAVCAMFVMLYRSGVNDNNVISNYKFFWQ